MGMDSFAPFSKNPLCFIVTNITPSKKTINIFKYPIGWGKQRDLIKIPGVSESSIRASLLKGELQHKILAGDIYVNCSDIDLIQFNNQQKQFLINAGIINGIDSGSSSNINYAFKDNIALIGAINGINKTFFTPDKFINGNYFNNIFHIKVRHNGKELYENIDYTIGESGGAGTGYDMINIYSFTPNQNSILYCDYVIKI